MSAIIDKVKEKVSDLKTKSQSDKPNDEQSFSIQPHPAKTNDPNDLNPPGMGGGLRSDPHTQAHHARDPHVPSQDVVNSLEQPASRDELRARAAELNQ